MKQYNLLNKEVSVNELKLNANTEEYNLQFKDLEFTPIWKRCEDKIIKQQTFAEKLKEKRRIEKLIEDIDMQIFGLQNDIDELESEKQDYIDELKELEENDEE